MKKQFYPLAFLLLLTTFLSAQAPQSIPYQAVARNSAGTLLSNQPIGLRFTIREDSNTGVIVYRETQNISTNKLGLFSTSIGAGNAVIGIFANISWANGIKYLQVEIDPTGGASYIDMGTTKMESVPFAFHAATGGTPQIQSDWMQSNVSALDFIKNKPSILSGSGSANYVPKWIAPNTLSNTSAIYNDANDNIGVGTSVVAAKLHVAQSANAIGIYVTGGGNDLDIARFKRDIGASGVIGVKSPGSDPQMYFDREVANGTWAMGVRSISGDQSFTISGNNSIGIADRLVINRSDGSVTLSNLAGSGIRPVYADDNGKLRASVTTWQLIDASDFQTGDDNWIAAEGNYSGTSGTAIRALTAIASASTTNYGLISSGTNNVAFQKTIDLTNVPHTQVMVRFHYYCFDSWEQWERGVLNASGDGTTFTTIWAKPWWANWSQYHFFGSGTYFDHEFENEIAIYNHTSNSLVLRFTNTQGASLTSEESFGIDNIEIYVR